MTTQTIEATKNGAPPKTTATPTSIGSYLQIEQLHPSPQNPRKVVGDLAELKAALQDRGLLVPILVRPTPKASTPYEIVFGERRWRALKEIGETVVRCEVRELTDDQALELMLVEYVQRVDLAPLEEAAAFASLRDKLKLDAKGIAKLVKKTAAYVFKQLRLDGLSKKAKASLTAGDLLLGAARQLAMIEGAEAQDVLLPRLIRREEHGYEHQPASEKQAKEIVNGSLRKLKDAPFDIARSPFVIIGDVDAGACTVCPKNTGAQLVLLGETAADDDRCTDAKCWAAKVKVTGDLVLEEAKKSGKPIVKDRAIWADSGRLAHDAPYVDLAEHEPHSATKWKKVLENSGLRISVGVDNDGKAHDLADKKAAEAFAKNLAKKLAKGTSSPSSSSSSSPGTKRVVDEADKIEQAKQWALASAVALKAEKASPAAILRIVAASLGARSDDVVANLLERRGLAAGKGVMNTFDALIEKADITKLQGIVAELLAGDSYDTDNVCEALKLDIDAIEEKAADAFKAEAKLEDAKGKAAAPAAKPTKKTTAKKGGKKK